ncbi:MAG: c-type cytochrome biogenesis protein CcsB [Prochlorotrichaceae cyanobacterium]|jgi:cytochrome c-type biogenesis protein CcsB
MTLVHLESLLDNAAFLILFLTVLVYWCGAAFPRIPGLAPLSQVGMLTGNLTIAALLIARWIEGGYFPISNLYESLFFLAWGLTTLHLVAEQMSQNRFIGVFTSPLTMGIVAFAALTLPSDMQVSAPLVPALKSNWLMMHVSVMMLSYATLMVGAMISIAFLVVTRGQAVELRGSSVGTGSFRDRLKAVTTLDTPEPAPSITEETPLGTVNAGASAGTAVLQSPVAVTVTEPLLLTPQRLTLADTLDNISYRIIGLGFPLLTIGIISGAVWANEAWGSYWSWDPKETWALITWLVFAAYLHARITRGWQGRRPAWLAATGFAVVWVCYLGVNLLGKGLHSYGWFF